MHYCTKKQDINFQKYQRAIYVFVLIAIQIIMKWVYIQYKVSCTMVYWIILSMFQTDIVFRSITSSLNLNLDDATVGVPFTMTFELEVPPPTTPNVATPYVLEIFAPFDGSAPIFSVCSFKVISVGKDLPCLRKDDLVTEYSSRVTGVSPLDSDRAKIDLGTSEPPFSNLFIASLKQFW